MKSESKDLQSILFWKQTRKLNCDFWDTVLPENSKFQEKVIGVQKCISVLDFPVATKCYLETSRGCSLVRLILSLYFYFLKDFIYLSLEGKGGRQRERNIRVWWVLSCAPYQGPGPQSRHVPWLGIEPVTPCFAGWHSIHWAIPARAYFNFFKGYK